MLEFGYFHLGGDNSPRHYKMNCSLLAYYFGLPHFATEPDSNTKVLRGSFFLCVQSCDAFMMVS